MIKQQPDSGRPVIDPKAEQQLSDRYGPIVATGGLEQATKRSEQLTTESLKLLWLLGWTAAVVFLTCWFYWYLGLGLWLLGRWSLVLTAGSVVPPVVVAVWKRQGLWLFLAVPWSVILFIFAVTPQM